jgi:2-dehydropantoate 2-reductase
MRTIILGAGAIGGVLGGLLARAGHDVVLVARGAHLEALRRAGLELRTPSFQETRKVPAIAGPEEIELTPEDRLVLAVKTQDTTALVDTWAQRPVRGGGVAADRLALFCLQNGVENERLALRRFANVYGACLWMPTGHLTAGVVVAYAAPFAGMLHVGRYPEGVDEACESFVELLEQSALVAVAASDVMRWKWAKLISNLANVVEALIGLGTPESGDVVERVNAEAHAVLAAAGIAHASKSEEKIVRSDRVEVTDVEGEPRGGGSTWQSLARGASQLETDYLNGEITLLGRQYGVPTPLNAGLQRLAAEAVRERWAPGSLSAEELLRRLASS